MKKLYLILSILTCVPVVYSQSAVIDTIYFSDKTIDIGVIIDSYGQSITLKPEDGNAVTISYDKATIDSTTNPLYTEEYFAAYKQELIEKSIAENQMKTDTKYVNPKIKKAKIITFVGLTTGLATGIGTYILFYANAPSNLSILLVPAAFIASGVLVNIGISRWIYLSVKTKQSVKKPTYLTFSTKGLGAQMVLHF